MRIKCERCGGWVDESYTHVQDGLCVCVMCALFDRVRLEWEQNGKLPDWLQAYPQGGRQRPDNGGVA